MNARPEMMERRDRLAVLARCRTGRLQELWNRLGLVPSYKALRGPEFGLIMLRGRVGGTGGPFNLGEATVTRASVRLDDGAVGHAIALGRDETKARLSALIDALCQNPGAAARIDEKIIGPMRRELAEDDDLRQRQTAATRVDFFTMVRGED